MFATTITEINENYGKHEILVNGQRPGYCSNNDNNNRCSDKLASFEKVDGGYYIETPATSGNDAWLRVTVGGSRTPDCGGVPTFSCPNNLSYAVNSSVAITPANISGCGDGCSYTISSGGSTIVSGNNYTGGALSSFTGSSTTGTENYTVALTNSVGSTSHNCSVRYTSGSSVTPDKTITKSGDKFSFSSSGDYAILVQPATSSTCSISCNGDGAQVSMSVGTEYSDGPGWYVSFSLPCENGDIINLSVTGAVKDCMVQW